MAALVAAIHFPETYIEIIDGRDKPAMTIFVKMGRETA
jgi:hypothetical protein